MVPMIRLSRGMWRSARPRRQSSYDIFYFDAAAMAKMRWRQVQSGPLGVKAFAIRPAFISGIRRSTGCPTPRCNPPQGIDRFPDEEYPGRTPALPTNGYDVYAPNGFDDAMIVRPNPGPTLRQLCGRKHAAGKRYGLKSRFCADSRETAAAYLTTPEIYPGLRRGGLMSFFRKQCAALPA